MALWLRYVVQAGLTTAVLWPSRRQRVFRTGRPVLQSGVFGTWLTGREVLARKRLESPESSIAAIAGADAN